MARKVCDFCLNESTGLFNGYEKLPDGHYICKDCKNILRRYDLPIKYELFQCLVTAQSHMKEMIMDAYLSENDAEEALAKYYPMPSILLHGGERCINQCDASITVASLDIPDTKAVTTITEVTKFTINNIHDADEGKSSTTIYGKIYETDAALYFLSENFINCHRLGHIIRNGKDDKHLIIKTPTKTFTYTVDNPDLLLLRERFYNKTTAALHNKGNHLIYMQEDNKVTITPGVYEIPRSLRAGKYKVRAIKDAGLHIKDQLGRIQDVYETDELIDLSTGGTLECTGEYQLQWIGENTKETM